MYLFVFFATLLCLTTAAPAVNEDLQNDINDFMEIIPFEKIKKIAVQHLHDDPDFQAAIQYITSPEWLNMVAELVQQPEVKELKEFLKEAGINLDKYGIKLCGFLRNVTVRTDHKERSLENFIAEVRQIIPMSKIIEAFDNKMSKSPAFKKFYEKITSEKAHQLVSKVRALPIFQKIADEVTLMGIDVERIFKVVYAVFGWSDEAVTPVA